MERGFTVWLTGLSGAGKSTIAAELARTLRRHCRHVEILDGDELREHLSKGLGFSREDRDTNIARISYVAKLLTRNGVATIVAAISPYERARSLARERIGNFIEVFVRCDLGVLEARDTKGLYAKARSGEVANFTGLSDPYEVPASPDIILDTHDESINESTSRVIDYLVERGYIVPRALPA